MGNHGIGTISDGHGVGNSDLGGSKKLVAMIRALNIWMQSWPAFVASVAVLLGLFGLHQLSAAHWIDYREIHIGNAKEGQSPVVTPVRLIKRNFYGEWSVSLRRFENGGFAVKCSTPGNKQDYRAGASVPTDADLDWLMFGSGCGKPPPGRYITTTTVTVLGDWPMPNKTTSIESNIFEVSP